MNKFLVAGLMIFILQPLAAQSGKVTGFYEKNIVKEISLESAFD